MNELLFPSIDPVAFSLGPLAVRWQGLSYVAGYLILYVTYRALVKVGYLEVSPTSLNRLVYWVAGMTLAGGRLGEALFYNHFLLNPILFFQVWEGGLSFHGALLGTVSGCYIWSKRNGADFFRVADATTLAIGPGLFVGGLASFVNGEPHGEALGEGLLLGALMWLAWWLFRKRPWHGGLLASAFVPAYGVVCLVIELFREPDPRFVTPENPSGAVVACMTMSQVLCALTILVGSGLVIWRIKTPRVEKP